MTRLVLSNKPYFTAEFNAQTDKRQIEICCEQLLRILYNNDADTNTNIKLLDDILALRDQFR